MTALQTILKIEEAGVMPLFYHTDEEVCLKITELSLNNNLKVLEFTNRGPYALSIFKQLREFVNRNYPGTLLGAGTITSRMQADNFLNAGADFLVSPVYIKELRSIHDITLYIPGGSTINEIYSASVDGAQLIKVFPADVVKPGFLKHVHSVLPHVKLMPTGGIGYSQNEMKQWFDAGAACLGIGTALFKPELINSKNWQELNQNLEELDRNIKIIKTPLF